ncbi:MAG: hypothetical protein ACTHJH_02570 [Marmoricola sp.]
MSTSEPTPDELEQQQPADPADAVTVPATSTGIEEPGTIGDLEDQASEADLVEQRQEAGIEEVD